MSYPALINAGVDLAQVDTDQQFPEGTEVIGSDGATYRYVLAGAAVTAEAAVIMDSALNKVKNSSALTQAVRGVAPVAIASSSYGWIITRGPVTVLTATGVAAGDALGTTATAGTVDTITTATASGVSMTAITAVASGVCTAFLA